MQGLSHSLTTSVSFSSTLRTFQASTLILCPGAFVPQQRLPFATALDPLPFLMEPGCSQSEQTTATLLFRTLGARDISPWTLVSLHACRSWTPCIQSPTSPCLPVPQHLRGLVRSPTYNSYINLMNQFRLFDLLEFNIQNNSHPAVDAHFSRGCVEIH